MKMHKAALGSLVLLFLNVQALFAQHETGLADEDLGYDTTNIVALPGSKADLPIFVDLKPYCPTPGNQGSITSCVGWSVGYGLLTIEKAIQNGQTDTRAITNDAFSALFVYNQIKNSGSCTSLSSISDALDFLKYNGNCLAKEFDFDKEDCRKRPNSDVKTKARNNTIVEYARLFNNDTEGPLRRDIIRSVLAQKKPIVIGLKVNDEFQRLGDVDYWYPSLGGTPSNGHAMVIVGYNDENQSFTLFNSWGTGWGKEGFIKVKYKDLVTYCRYAYIIHTARNAQYSEPVVVSNRGIERPQNNQIAAPTNGSNAPSANQQQPSQASTAQNVPSPTRPIGLPNKQRTEPTQTTAPSTQPMDKQDNVGVEAPRELVEMAGQFELKAFTRRWTAKSEPIFETVGVEKVGNHYEVLKKDWHVGDQFQLALTSNVAGAHIYILTVNPLNEVSIIFPRNEEYGRQYRGKFESALMMLDGARILLPNPNKTMIIKQAGKDRICILFSTHKIRGIPKLCELVQGWKGDFDTHFQKLLNTMMVPNADTNFSQNQVAFSVSTRSLGSIVPMIIEFKSE